MSILLPRQDKGFVIDLIQRALERLAFHKLSPNDRAATMGHLQSMREDKRPMNVLCQLATSPTGKTQLVLTCDFVDLQEENKTA